MKHFRSPRATVETLLAELAALKRIEAEMGKTEDKRIDTWLQNVKNRERDIDEIQQESTEINDMDGVMHQTDSSRRVNLNKKVIRSIKAVKALKETAVEMFLGGIPEDKLKRFSQADIISFTSQPPQEIGSGGSGKVYKGQFANGVQVAIKILIHMDVIEEIFMSEINTILKVSHPNIIQLYGFCSNANVKALVYEFMPKGSLDVVLFKNPWSVEWETMYGMAIEIAKALAYLHHGCHAQIIHHDLKPSNVLVGPNHSPKITDFGTTRIMNKDMSHFTMTQFRGTRGYIAPEMGMYLSRVTYKCDVFSFGKVLFDILGMRSNTQIRYSLPKQVWDKFDKGELDVAIKDCGLEDDIERARILSKVALWCIQHTPEIRPSMTDVVSALEEKIKVAKPPNPFLAWDGDFSMQQSQDVIYSTVFPVTHKSNSQPHRTNPPARVSGNPNEVGIAVADATATSFSDLTFGNQRFTHADVRSFTSDFSKMIGNSNVFIGQFPNGVTIVVKKLIGTDHHTEETFIDEIRALLKTSHLNVVKLYGFCFERDMKALVLEYMPKRSLGFILYKTLSSETEWEKLYNIAIETAKGVSYLHDSCDYQIIHCKVRASSVLLDQNLCPKITNFGLAKLQHGNELHQHLSKFNSGHGYSAPELMTTSDLTDKCDVFSFGMILFEVLGGRRILQAGIYYPRLVWERFEKREFEEIIKECGITEQNREKALILCMVALWCIQYTPENRPSMTTVVKMLEKEIKAAMPPDPFVPSVPNSMKPFVDVVYDYEGLTPPEGCWVSSPENGCRRRPKFRSKKDQNQKKRKYAAGLRTGRLQGS